MQLSKTSSLKQLKALAKTALKPSRALTGLRYRAATGDVPEASRNLPSLGDLAPTDDAFRELSFTFALIALSAKVASAGAPLTREKYIAFRDAFPLSGGICGKIRALFALASADGTSFEHYVTQIKFTYPGELPLFASLADRLFSIAAADGALTREQERLLAKISRMFGLTASEYSDIHARYTEPRKAHEILGVSKKDPARKIKKRYHELMRHYHPDHFAQDKLSPEMKMLLELKVSEINAAYRRLSRRAA